MPRSGRHIVALAALIVMDGCIYGDHCVNGARRVDGECVLPTDAGPDAGFDASRADGGEPRDGATADCTAESDCAARANATATCEAGSCRYECDDGWGDCNGEPADGCEKWLRDDPGGFEGSLSFDGSTLPNAGGVDLFVWRLAQ